MKKINFLNLAFWSAAVVIGAGLLMFAYRVNQATVERNADTTPEPSVSMTTTLPSPTQSNSATPGPTLPVPKGISTVAPQCRLAGEFTFSKKNNYYIHPEHEFFYDKVEDPRNLVHWTISPFASVSMGPNMMSGLVLPMGSDVITFTFLDGAPQYERYILTATMDYVGWDGYGSKIYNVKCLGQAVLKIGE